MGEAKRRREQLRATMLEQSEFWTGPDSEWETALVEELLDMKVERVPRMATEDIAWMRMPANACHANTRFYESNDPTGQGKSVTGWWLQGLDFVLHSVLGNSGQYCCITPSAAGEAEIFFVPDPKISWIEMGDVYSPVRNGQIVGLGVRRFPAFTRAMNDAVRTRLIAGMDPYRAIEFRQQEMAMLQVKHLTSDQIAELR